MFEKFKNIRVLITGNTGFKGSWLSLWLNKLDASIYGLSDRVVTEPSFFDSGISDLIKKQYFVDINDEQLSDIINEIKPDYIFHLAAQSLVMTSYDIPLETMLTNALGTINLLNAVKEYEDNLNLILITSDKVYENYEWTWGYRENDHLGGLDPYSASKSMAEIGIRSYINSFFKSKSNIRIAIARAGNVIGGGDWSKDRIIPDAVRSWQSNKKLYLRKPNATRPWQHVLEPISGYLTLADKLNDERINGEAFNFGPELSFRCTVENLISNLPNYWRNFQYESQNTSQDGHHEAGLLALNCDKAKNVLDWFPVLSLHDTLKYTAEWYKNFYSNKINIIDYSIGQIDEYVESKNRK